MANSEEYAVLGNTSKINIVEPENTEKNTLKSNEEQGLGDGKNQGKHSYVWNDESIKLLIHAYVQNKDKFDSPLHNKKSVWNKISMEMAQNGIFLDGAKCSEKWRNLKKTYDKVLKTKKETGSGNCSTWKFFELFHEIYFKDPHFNPISSLSSSSSMLSFPDKNLCPLGESRKTELSTPSTSSTPTNMKKRKSVYVDAEERKDKRHRERLEQKERMFKWFQEFTKKE